MKLCHIVPSLEEQHGGPSKSVRALCSAMADGGSDVELLATDPGAPAEGRRETAGPLRVRIFRRDWPQRICPSAGLRQALATHDGAILHHHSIWLRTLHYAHQQAQRSGRPLVISPRGMMSTWAWRHRGWRKRLSRAFIHPGALEQATAWHATSVEEEQEIRALGFRQPICVAPNGVEAATSADIASAAAHWRELCPDVSRRRVALFYSRFHQKKRVLELIDLWRASAPADWLLLLVGIPQDYTPEMLEHYAHKTPGSARVLAFSGAGRPPPYAVASLFLLPSHNENFGLVIAEAMAHGVPVVVTDTTPWRAINNDGLGWCVPWDNYATTLIRATGESSAQLAERGRAAQTWVIREFSWAKSAETLVSFYATLGGSRR
jgi:glycosyltransferase involved in cell wall biosynthesis